MSQELFYKFASEMSSMLKVSLVDFSDQEQLLNKLFNAENQFKKELLKTKRGKAMYDKFMTFILKDQKNILAARIYFRERQNTFSRHISKAFYNENPNQLVRFRINYWFVGWVIDNHPEPNRKLRDLFTYMQFLRTQLCETNLPLAVNRAKIFWSRSRENQLEYMDLIQACSEGLLNAIDKFVPPYKGVFKSTAIGRMVSNMIDDHNSTLVKFSPKERRILYRARNAMTKQHLQDMDDIVKYVNESFKGVTKEYLYKLLNAATMPTSLTVYDEDQPDLSQVLADDTDIESDVIDIDLKEKMRDALHVLSHLEKKAIVMTYGIVTE